MEIVVDIERVGIHPYNENIRGVNPSLTGLRESVLQSGQAYALGAVPGEDGTYLVYEGARRLAAMTAVGFTEVRLSVENLTDEQVLARIAASDIKEPLPHVVAKKGIVTGGKSWLVRQMLDGGSRKDEIAAALNITLDEVSGYLALHSEEESTLSAVASGTLAFSAYCRIKYKSPEFKAQLLEGKKRVSVREVLKAIESDSPVSRRKEANPEPVETSAVNPSALLRDIWRNLLSLRGMDYAPDPDNDMWVDIVYLVEKINGGTNE